ncbi:biotin--[acetyl-CoA-carboxylase] ligase [Evansella sp. AB-P1]|uniref:biotin--[acetyl-CoA-carboxylase] ligase n=1 Tax=Evansella sp. AB-P1 TaxID=3037653 RepID=UPI00241D9A05|nr:biotin--[acetyl-CoA-carboxylase] ligase [Evansella sp. AB-P1]MDG5787567.1 biotin--[acetyl-CoA-carboxylase] ligase [Evansella sp. AB-P1]
MKGKVLQLLRDHSNEYISGEKISQALSISRTMVWKYIDALRKEGYDIIAVSNKGYLLKGEVDSLSEHGIQARLDERSIFRNVVYQPVLESTQQLAQQLLQEKEKNGQGTIVIANEQTGGRGRLGRDWHSPKNTGVWMSIILYPKLDIRQTPQLTLLTAVAVVRAIEKITELDVHIKWPNDILINKKKVAGILTELQADPDRVKSVIIGIGLNVNQTSFPEEIKDIATSIAIEGNKGYKRIDLIEAILFEFQWLYEVYLSKGFSFIKPLWEARTTTLGKRITATTPRDVITGVADRMDDDGVLLLKDDEGVIHRIYSADIKILHD